MLWAITCTVMAAEALRLPDMPLHDPYILAHAESRTYYLYTSNLPRMSGTPGWERWFTNRRIS